MECKLSDLNYGDKFRFSPHGYIHLIADIRGIDCVYDPSGFMYIVNISTGSMDQVSLIDSEDLIVWKEV